MAKTAIILGASGLTGGLVLRRLLEDERYSCIKLFGRAKLEIDHEKVQQFVGDLLDLETFQAILQVTNCIAVSVLRKRKRRTKNYTEKSILEYQ